MVVCLIFLNITIIIVVDAGILSIGKSQPMIYKLKLLSCKTRNGSHMP